MGYAIRSRFTHANTRRTREVEWRSRRRRPVSLLGLHDLFVHVDMGGSNCSQSLRVMHTTPTCEDHYRTTSTSCVGVTCKVIQGKWRGIAKVIDQWCCQNRLFNRFTKNRDIKKEKSIATPNVGAED